MDFQHQIGQQQPRNLRTTVRRGRLGGENETSADLGRARWGIGAGRQAGKSKEQRIFHDMKSQFISMFDVLDAAYNVT